MSKVINFNRIKNKKEIEKEKQILKHQKRFLKLFLHNPGTRAFGIVVNTIMNDDTARIETAKFRAKLGTTTDTEIAATIKIHSGIVGLLDLENTEITKEYSDRYALAENFDNEKFIIEIKYYLDHSFVETEEGTYDLKKHRELYSIYKDWDKTIWPSCLEFFENDTVSKFGSNIYHNKPYYSMAVIYAKILILIVDQGFILTHLEKYNVDHIYYGPFSRITDNPDGDVIVTMTLAYGIEVFSVSLNLSEMVKSEEIFHNFVNGESV